MEKKIYDINTTIKDFSDYVYKKYNDSWGDLGVLDFLRNKPECFSASPNLNNQYGVSPKSWDLMIDSLRVALEENVAESEYLKEVSELSKNILGDKIGYQFATYVTGLTLEANPLAREFILLNNPDITTLEGKYSDGVSAQNILFGYQFATAAANYSIQLLEESNNPKKILEEVSKRLGTAILQLNDSEYSFGLNHFREKLKNNFEEFSEKHKYGEGRELLHSIVDRIACSMNDLNDMDGDKRYILIGVMTGFEEVRREQKEREEKKASDEIILKGFKP